MRDKKDPAYDPLYRQLVVRLESLPANSKSFALTKAGNGYVLWYYDPKNRIMSPRIVVFKDMAELTAQLVASLIGDHDDDPRIKETPERALEWAELHRLEFHARVFARGGYTVKDPELTKDTSKPLKDSVRAAETLAKSKSLRKKLERLR